LLFGEQLSASSSQQSALSRQQKVVSSQFEHSAVSYQPSARASNGVMNYGFSGLSETYLYLGPQIEHEARNHVIEENWQLLAED
jgi:hypothetical protein